MAGNGMERRHDLDWVRVGVFGLLILYHVGMLYVSWDYHIKSAHRSLFLENLMVVVNQWRLPLLFLVSGAAVYFVLQKVSLVQFAGMRSLRLLLPLAFGMFVIVLPQVYFELKFKGYSDLTVLGFLKAYYTLDQSYDTSIPTWNHLWYIAYLWVYSFAVIPLALLIKGIGAKHAKWLSFDAYPGWVTVALPMVVFGVYFATLRPLYPETHDLTHDWFNHAFYLTVFVFGYMLAASRTAWNWLAIHRRKIIASGLASTGLILLIRNSPIMDLDWPTWFFLVTRLLLTANLWLWILGILALAFVHLKRKSPVLSYLNEAVYPYYILHQTIIISIGYPISQSGLFGIYEESALIVISTFGLCFLLHEFVIRRNPVLRPLFGLGPKAKNWQPSPAPQTIRAPAGE